MRGKKRFFVVMLSFLLTVFLVPAVKGQAAAKKTVSAPKNVTVYFSDGPDFSGKNIQSRLVGQAYIFLKNMPSNGKISVLSTGNRKVTAESRPGLFSIWWL